MECATRSGLVFGPIALETVWAYSAAPSAGSEIGRSTVITR